MCERVNVEWFEVWSRAIACETLGFVKEYKTLTVCGDGRWVVSAGAAQRGWDSKKHEKAGENERECPTSNGSWGIAGLVSSCEEMCRSMGFL